MGVQIPKHYLKIEGIVSVVCLKTLPDYLLKILYQLGVSIENYYITLQLAFR